MKTNLLIILGVFIVAHANLLAQVDFQRMEKILPVDALFEGIYSGNVEFVDVDGDSDYDVLGCGNGKTILYFNDGNGNFTQDTSVAIVGTSSGYLAIADIDGDSDQDVIITGNYNSDRITKLYTNNGLGVFTEVQGTTFPGVTYSFVAFQDIDNDSDADLILMGTGNNSNITQTYKNDGLGNFVPVLTQYLPPIHGGAATFADYDGDSDIDLFLVGGGIAKLYQNDGNGMFYEDITAVFTGVQHYNTADWGDIDGDGDPDLIYNGSEPVFPYNGYVGLYINGPNGFTEYTGTDFIKTNDGELGFLDMDGDNDLDIFITGRYNHAKCEFYSNDGNGIFSEVENENIAPVFSSTFDFQDVDNDNDKDLLIAGKLVGATLYLYLNDGNGVFNVVNAEVLKPGTQTSCQFFDMDNDDDQDLIMSGTYGYEQATSLFENIGSGVFEEKLGAGFYPVQRSSLAVADVDGNGFKDVVLSGTRNGRHTKLYLNTGGVFSESNSSQFAQLSVGSLAFGDVDGDADYDLAVSGIDTNNVRMTLLYMNDGLGAFTLNPVLPFDSIWYGDMAFADVDGDFDLDLTVVGGTRNGRIAKIYENDGSGNYSEMQGTNLEAMYRCDIEYNDFDEDGDQDLIMSGETNTGIMTMLFENNGIGSFTEVNNTPFIDVTNGSVTLIDVDTDGDKDVLLTGEDAGYNRNARLYLNNGGLIFTEITGTPFSGTFEGDAACADIDGDQDFDLLITGISDTAYQTASLYLNNSFQFSINEYEEQEGIIYPNPARNKIYVEFDELTQYADILDVHGKTIRRIQLNNFTEGIDVSDLSAGCYYLQVTQPVNKCLKFVITR